ncbi:MAG: AMP-binding protein [Rhodospirillales bacterium]|nr:AMP-binding protein [Alphaproteobacteria bacterium]MBL6947789.1 AMP-binding protein [Rhodospirillales bacterium]
MTSTGDAPRDFIGCLQDNAKRLADKVCLHVLLEGGATSVDITFSDLMQKAQGFAEALEDAGTGPGDVVLVFLNHHPDMAACYMGAMLAGAIPSFMPCPSAKQHPERYWPAHEALFRRIRPKAILTDAGQASQMKQFGLDSDGVAFLDVDSVDASSVNRSFPSMDPGGIALLQHSSGTTGLKKGMALSHQAILNQVHAYTGVLDIQEDDVIVSWLPLYHDMGLMTSLILPLALGRTAVLMDPFQWTARPAMLFEAIEKYDGRYVWLPNFAFEHLCRTAGRMQPLADLSKVRAFINCSEPCKLETFTRFAETFSDWGIRPDQLQACYALAENVFAVSQTPLGRQPSGTPLPEGDNAKNRTVASVGTVLPGVGLRILDESGQPLGEGETGEIAITGTCLFKEYFMLEDLTSERVRDGYFLTHDLGFLKDGELFILGRSDDLIIVNGRNHYAHDLEALVNGVEGLKPGRCAVFGVFNETLGTEEVIVVAERDPKAGIEDAALKKTVKETLFDEADLIIRDARIVGPDWLVKTSSGKISREGNKSKYLSHTE